MNGSVDCSVSTMGGTRRHADGYDQVKADPSRLEEASTA